VVVADWTDGDEIHVAIGDNGPGVPLAERERVFEPFVRGDATTDGDRPGSGVGLFAARRLMAGMGGRLWIEDKLAGGTQFVAAIPAAPPKATAAAATPPTVTSGAVAG
jgi:signal transduction histidine kinase